MIELYKNRGGQGKCETNGFLMNRAPPANDSASSAEAGIDKTFVIQNLFRQRRKSTPRGKFFLFIRLTSRCPPDVGRLLWNLGTTIGNYLKIKDKLCLCLYRLEAMAAPAHIRNSACAGK
jgi:hypothetical protein